MWRVYEQKHTSTDNLWTQNLCNESQKEKILTKSPKKVVCNKEILVEGKDGGKILFKKTITEKCKRFLIKI